jgi:methionine-S-sulfoxide reductase
MRRFARVSLALLLIAGWSGSSGAARGLSASAAEASALFAGGCFWGVEAVFEHLRGVESVTSGYARYVGKDSPTAVEAVRVRYDPARITYRQLLEVFFMVAHDPTTRDRQGPDAGPEYRSAVLYQDAQERAVAETYLAEVTGAGTFGRPVVTEVRELAAFRIAEPFHQDYAARNPAAPYIVQNDAPKLVRLQQLFPALYQQRGSSQQPAVVGLDHIPIAVNDLERAVARYRALGFSLKPGRPHDNGITNQHVKFPDGTELELITAPEARDRLTTTYRRHLASGDGPAFLAFFAPARERVPQQLHAPLDYIFFGGRNASPTDRPEHFAHANTAESFIEVWLAADNLSPERQLLEKLGASFTRREVHVPDAMVADVARLQEGEVVFLPASRQIVKGRRIIGSTLRVKSLATARQVIEGARLTGARVGGKNGSSIFLPPAVTHGLWLELREDKSSARGGI